MSFRRAFRSVILGCSLVGASLIPQDAESISADEPEEISLVELISHPQSYRDKTVTLVGFAVFEFEESAVYLSQLHAEIMDKANSLFLAGTVDRELNGRIVRIEAVFRQNDSHPRGYLDVKRIAVVQRVRHFESR
jgi:hypothetical protein